MTEMVVGDEAGLSAFAGQLKYIYENFPDVVLVGRLGRLAIYDHYSHFGWPDGQQVEPVQIVYGARRPRPDIDILFAPDELFDHRQAKTPHQIDIDLGSFVDLTEDGSVELTGNSGPDFFAIQTGRDLFSPRTRFLRVNGSPVPVRTFSIGVQQQIGHLARVPGEPEKYTRHRDQFDRFAEYMRGLQPDEFPAGEQLEPLLQANRRLIRRSVDK